MSMGRKLSKAIKILSTTTLLSFIVTTLVSFKTKTDIDYVGYGSARMTWEEYEQSRIAIVHAITNGVVLIVAGVLLVYVVSEPVKKVFKALLKILLYLVFRPLVGRNKAIIGAKKIVQ